MMNFESFKDLVIKTRTVHKFEEGVELPLTTLNECLSLSLMAPNHKYTFPWDYRVAGIETRKKLEDLAAHGLTQVTREKHVFGVGEWNKRYLNAKRDWGHKLAEEDLN